MAAPVVQRGVWFLMLAVAFCTAHGTRVASRGFFQFLDPPVDSSGNTPTYADSVYLELRGDAWSPQRHPDVSEDTALLERLQIAVGQFMSGTCTTTSDTTGALDGACSPVDNFYGDDPDVQATWVQPVPDNTGSIVSVTFWAPTKEAVNMNMQLFAQNALGRQGFIDFLKHSADCPVESMVYNDFRRGDTQNAA